MLRITHVLLSTALIVPVASAHGGLFRSPEGPTRRTSVGGSSTPRPNSTSPTSTSARPDTVVHFDGSPEVPYVDDRWEFWWDFHQDAFTRLRPRLRESAASVPGSRFTLPNESDRKQAILPALLKALRDSNEMVRSGAAYGLSRIEDDQVFSYLRYALAEDSSLTVRINSVVATGQARIARSLEPLREILWDDTIPDEERAMAAVSLGVLGTPEASTVLREAIEGNREGRLAYTIQLAATYALGLTEDPANAPFLRSLAVAPGQKDYALRALLVLGLGRVGDRAANPILIEAVQNDSESQVRRTAAIALGVIADAADLDVLKALEKAATQDPDPMVQNLSDIALGHMARRGAAPAADRLRARFRTETSSRRGFVALALGIAQDAAALPLLRAQLKEGSHSLQGAAAVALALIGSPEAIPDLRRALQATGDPALRGYIAYALGSLGDQESRKELRQILDTAVSPALIYHSSVALGLLADPALLEQLMTRYHKREELITRAALIHSVGLVCDRNAIDFLIDVSQDPAETDQVRAIAALALGMLCEQHPEPVTSIYTRDHNYSLDLPFLGQLYFLF